MSTADPGAVPYAATDDGHARDHHVRKRIAVCCDGTWQDGITVDQRWKYTNVLKLARLIKHTDMRVNPPVPQVVFYQSGVGTFGDTLIEDLDGAVGASLGDKVQEAYAFIAHNYAPGDEIFLFGFSRGAYTARMVAELIRGVGILGRTDMDHFADIFVAYQKRGSATDEAQIAALDAQLAPWTHADAPGKRRASTASGGAANPFCIKCVGVFDTVGSLGLPEEITHSKKMKTLFGFKDRTVGEHIERAYQVLALNEHRGDFKPAIWEQIPEMRAKGQVLQQCWFTGSHSDIGGGFQDHDLSDLTLAWLAANIEDIIYLDHRYLLSLPDPCAPWGALSPHNSMKGIYAFGDKIQRTIPAQTDDVTFQYIHPSVLRQSDEPNAPEASTTAEVRRAIAANPAILWPLLPLEEAVRDAWTVRRAPSTVTTANVSALSDAGAKSSSGEITKVTHFFETVTKDIVKEGHTLVEKITHTSGVGTSGASPGSSGKSHEHLVAHALRESSMGVLVKEIVAKWEGD